MEELVGIKLSLIVKGVLSCSWMLRHHGPQITASYGNIGTVVATWPVRPVSPISGKSGLPEIIFVFITT